MIDSPALSRFVMLIVVVSVAPCHQHAAGSDGDARRGPPDSRRRDASTIRMSFRKTIAPARRATVELLVGDNPVVLGTVVTDRGLLVTKASEVPAEVVCRFHNGRTVEARQVYVDRSLDLALYRTASTPSDFLQCRTDEKLPGVGTIVANCSSDAVPTHIGIVSVEPRAIPHQPGRLGVAFDADQKRAVIADVKPNSAAIDGGLRSGDVITALDGRPVDSPAGLGHRLRMFNAGEQVTMTFERESMVNSVTIRLRFPPEHLFSREAFEMGAAGALSHRRTGFVRVIQHDSVVEPHECGGPLIDLHGRLVGINVARAGRAMTYAVAVADVARVIRHWEQTQRPSPR